MKKNFNIMLETAEKFIAEEDRWYDFGIPICETNIGELPWIWFNTWVSEHFTDEGRGWIEWYLFERVSVVDGTILSCYDEDGNEFFVKNLEDLWKIVKEYIK